MGAGFDSLVLKNIFFWRCMIQIYKKLKSWYVVVNIFYCHKKKREINPLFLWIEDLLLKRL